MVSNNLSGTAQLRDSLIIEATALCHELVFKNEARSAELGASGLAPEIERVAPIRRHQQHVQPRQLHLRRRRTMIPMHSKARPNNSAVAGSGTPDTTVIVPGAVV